MGEALGNVDLITHSLLYGGYLSIAMSILIMGSLLYNPEIWLHDFPKDIQEKYGPPSKKSIRQRNLFAFPFMAIFFGILIAAVWTLPAAIGATPTFFQLAFSIFIVFMVFNLADLLILDWLIGIVLRPKFWVLPGTEGLHGYTDYSFHFKGFLKGTVGGLAGALVIGGIAYLLFSVL
jgi:hypothetical protein